MNPRSCSNFVHPLSRREALRRFGIGFGGLALAGLLGETGRAAAAAEDPLAPRRPHFPVRTKRIIFLFMHGGPSAVDSFDHKPALDKHDGQTAPRLPKLTFAAANGREGSKLWKSPWKFRPRGRSGIMVSELFPHTGELVDDLCLLHSRHGTAPDHGAVVLRMNTGAETFVRPSLGSWVLDGLGTENQNLPGFVTLCPTDKHGGVRNYGSAFLPATLQGTPLGTENTRPRTARRNPSTFDLVNGEQPYTTSYYGNMGLKGPGYTVTAPSAASGFVTLAGFRSLLGLGEPGHYAVSAKVAGT